MHRLLSAFLLLLPLFFLPWANQQFELPKFVLTLAAVGLLLFWWAHSHARNTQTEIPLKGVVTVAAAILIYLVIHSGFLSFIPDNSIWGSYQRHTGLLLWIGLAVIFVSSIKASLTHAHQDLLLRSMALGGVLASLVAISQWLIPGLWSDLAATNGRVYGTLGVPNFLGQWLLMTLLLSAYLLKQSRGIRPRLLWLLAFLVQMGGLVLSGNRASLLVFGILALVTAIVMLARMRATWQKGALASLMIMLLLVVGYGVISRSDGMFRSIESRAIMYPTAVEAILAHPIFGHGLDTLYTVFAARLPINLGASENLLDVPDKAHQIVLDTLMELGIVGVLLFLWLLVEIGRLSWRLMRHEEAIVRQRAAVITVALLAWMLSLLVSFPGVTERVYAVVLIGILVAQRGQTKALVERAWQRWLGVVCCVLCGLIVLAIGIGTLVADIKFAHLESSPVNDPLADVIFWTPIRMEYEIFGTNSTFANISLEDRRRHLENALAKNPQDVWAWTFLADVQGRMGAYEQAKVSLNNARVACPRCAFVALEGAQLAKNAGDTAAAKEWAGHYKSLLPAFLFADPATLSADELERRRITLKEQEQDLRFMQELLPELKGITE